MRNRLLRSRIAILLAFVLGAAPAVRAQAATGVISGTITDAQSGILPGVTITVVNAESGVERATVSDEEGRYRVAGLPPERYRHHRGSEGVHPPLEDEPDPLSGEGSERTATRLRMRRIRL